jgi:hypothetical protein
VTLDAAGGLVVLGLMVIHFGVEQAFHYFRPGWFR